jgi:hypothetical protein
MTGVTSLNYGSGQPRGGDGSTTRVNQAAIADAKQALAKANAAVDADRANHSPSCVACDQKLVDQAQAQLAQISAAARSAGLLDITV